VILQAGRPDWRALLGFLGHRGTPCLLIGSTREPRGASADRLPDLIDLEIVRIDLRARTIQVEGKPKVLPPKEFEILLQLTLSTATWATRQCPWRPRRP